jgi:hypothetical protein
MKNIIVGLKIGLAAALTLFVLVYVGTIFGPDIETELFPVVRDTEAHVISSASTEMVVGVSALKARNCALESIGVLVKKDGLLVPGIVKFQDPETGLLTARAISRPSGTRSFSVLHIYPGGEFASVYVFHQCHPFWQTKSLLVEVSATEM